VWPGFGAGYHMPMRVMIFQQHRGAAMLREVVMRLAVLLPSFPHGWHILG
jgi:hypothetical protein